MAAPRVAQLRAVGTAFLRQRPVVTLPLVIVNFGLFAAGGAPRAQLVALAAGLSLIQGMFIAERVRGAVHLVSETGLARSLILTAIGLAAGCVISGGLASPLVPLLLAPTGIAFAAFGRSRMSTALLAILIATACGLAFLPRGVPFPPLGSPHREVATAVGLVGSAVLLRLGVAALTDAHASAAAALARAGDDAVAAAATGATERERLGAHVAHEVKNPLAAIRGLVEVLIEARGGDDRDHKRLTVIAGEVERIERILHEYLDQHRPIAALVPITVDVGELVRDVAAVLEARAERSDVALVSTGSAAEASVDPRRLKEAILNLALNALDAASPGARVDLRWSREPDGVTIEVADTGRGMTADVLAKVGTPGFTTRDGGTGFGVVLARGVVEQHGGSLRFSSVSGQGTIATIHLPDRSWPRS